MEWWLKLCSDFEWCVPSPVQGLGTSSKNHWGKSFYRELLAVSLWDPICPINGLLPHSDLYTLQVRFFLSIFLINCTQEINSSTWYIVYNWKICFQFNRGDIVGKFLVESWSYSCKSRLRSDNCVDNDDVDGIYKRCSSKNLLRQIDRCVSWILLFYGVCFPFR